MSNKIKHNHTHNHSHNDINGASNVAIAFLLNFGFSIVEIIGGLIFGSVAILSDAVHDLGDSLALGLSYIFEKIGKRSSNNKYTYGYKRLSVIGAIINIVVLSVGTIFVFKEAVESFINPSPVIAEGMFIMAIFGILINGFSVIRMRGTKNILDRTVMMHLLEDLLGWVAVFIVSIVIYFTKLYILDSILTFIICVIIGRNIVANIVNVINIIMQAVPDSELYDEIKEHIMEIDGVESINAFNMWTLDGEEHIVTTSITTNKDIGTNKILVNIKEMLKEEGIHNSTIELT
jgi:cobalt-zinc-cadmium efflux system protein